MTNLEHINSLRSHGAQIKTGDTLIELTTAFYEKAVAGCREGGYNAVTYDLALPGIDEPMMLAVWKDGHVDSGSVKNIIACLAQGRQSLQGFFVRKPDHVKDAEDIIKWSTKHREVPVEINPIATVRLGVQEYMRFRNGGLESRDFLKPYADQSAFRDERHADCVIIEADGQRRIAVCLEGFDYPRYVAYIL